MRDPLLYDAARILSESTKYTCEQAEIILEDSNSPINNRYREKLYKDVIDKAHVDFGDIPRSKGDITKYSGYNSMIETLDALSKLADEEKSMDLHNYVNIINDAIKNIRVLKNQFTKGFTSKNDYVMLEYNIYTFTCVEATTSLIYEFVDYIKTPSSPTIKIALKDTKYRANLFYIQQLEKFNKVNKNGNYIKLISTICNKGQENFFGIDDGIAVGIGAITVIFLSIIPVTRELIYQYKELRRKLSESLELQAYFLEMNKAAVEANDSFNAEKKKKILAKQEKLRLKLIKLADKLRVSSVKAKHASDTEMNRNNKDMSADNINKEIEDDDDFSIL